MNKLNTKIIEQINSLLDQLTKEERDQLVADMGYYKAVWTIRRFDSEKEHAADNPYNVSKIDGNLLLNEGINELWTIACSAGGTKWDNTNAYLGVGDSSAAADPTQTDLQGANKVYVGMDSGYPTYGTSQKATWRSTFGAGVANQA